MKRMNVYLPGLRMLLIALLLSGASFGRAQQVQTERGERKTILPAGTAIAVRVIDNINVVQLREDCKYRVITETETQLDGTIVVPRGTFGHVCIAREPGAAGPGRNSLYGIRLTDLSLNGKDIQLDSSTERITVDPTGSTYPGPRNGVTIRADTVITFNLKSPAAL